LSIYESIGGAPAVRAAVDGLYLRLLADPALAPHFATVDLARLKAHQRAFLDAALGGPQNYAGQDLAAAHAGLDITDADFDGVVAHLVDTLTELGVPAQTIAEIGETLTPLRGAVVSRSLAG
jgi:hemoglobin